MFELSAEERLALATRVHKRAAGRCAVLGTGTYGGTVEEMAADVRAMGACCDAVVVVTCFLAKEEEDEAVWLRTAQQLIDLTPGIPLGTYECPVPYKRLLSPDAMGWLGRSGRFRFHKDTCCDMQVITAKIQAVGGGSFSFFNANVETLLPSLQA